MKRSIAIDLPDGETGDLQRRTCDLSILTDDLRGHLLRMPRPGERRRSVETILLGTSDMPDVVVVSTYAAQGDDVLMRPASIDDLMADERRALDDCDRDVRALIVLLDGDRLRFRQAMAAFEDAAVAALRAWNGGSVPIWLAYRRFGSERFQSEADAFAERYCAVVGEALFEDVESIPRTSLFSPAHPTAQRIAARFESRIVRESTGAIHGRWSDERGRRMHWTTLADGSSSAEVLFGSARLAYIEVDRGGKIRLSPKRSEIDPFVIDLVEAFIEEAVGDDYGPLFRGAI